MANVGCSRSDPAIEACVESDATEPRSTKVAQIDCTVSEASSENIGPPPDGGWFAYMQVALVHITIINTWGFINSFGFFQAYYVITLQRGPSDIAWVGSFQIWLLFAVGVFAGRAADAGYFKMCYMAGSLLLTLGLFMTSLCSEYWQFFLAQGVCQGIGNGLIFIPTLTILPGYFKKHKAVAMSTAAAGTGTGAMIYSAIIQALLPQIGFRWTIRIIGFIVLTLQTINLFLLRHRIPPRKTGPFLELQAFKDPTYTLTTIAFFLINMGIWFAYVYVPSFASTILGVDQGTSYRLLLILNGPGIPGRLIPALIADRYTGTVNMLILFTLATSIITFTWTTVSTYAGFIGWCAVYGFFSAGFLGLLPASIACLTEDEKKVGIRLGMVFSIIGFANLIGPPVCGALIQRMDGRYLDAQIFSALCCTVGSFILVIARVNKVGYKLSKRM